jgi:hypothetical protein
LPNDLPRGDNPCATKGNDVDRTEWSNDDLDRMARMVSMMAEQINAILHMLRANDSGIPPPSRPYGSGSRHLPPGMDRGAFTAGTWQAQMEEMANPMTSAVVESSYPDAGRLGGTAVGILCVRPGTDIRWARRRGLDPSRRSIVVSVIDGDQGTHMPVVLDVEDAKQLVNRLADAITAGDDPVGRRNWPWPGSDG